MFAETGLTSAVIQRSKITDEHLSTVFWLNLGVATVLALIGAAAAPLAARMFDEPRTTMMVAVIMMALPIAALGQVPEAILQRRLSFRAIAAIEWIGTTVSGVAAISLAYAGAGAWALVLQALVAAGIGAVGRIAAVRWVPALVFRKEALKDLSSFSFSVFGGNLLNYGFRKIDNFLIGKYLGAAALGYYALAYNLILFPLLSCGGVILRVMFPTLSRLQHDLPRLRSAYLRTVRMLGTLTLPLVIGIGSTAPLLVLAAYGPQWAPSVPLIRILTVIGILEAVNTTGILLYAIGKPGILVRWAIVSVATMTIAFSIGLRWGVPGVAWTYVVISPILFLMPHFFANRAIGLSAAPLISAILPSFGSAVLMAVIVVGVQPYVVDSIQNAWWAFLTTVAVGAIVYCGAMFAIGAVMGRSSGGAVSWLLGNHLVSANVNTETTETVQARRPIDVPEELHLDRQK